jgi:hypothetical protein
VSFKVGWPSEGSLDRETSHRVYQVVTGMSGHPDQFPYIDIWQTLAAHPPWLKKCFEDSCKIMVARAPNTGTVKRKKIRKRAPPPSAPDAPQHGGTETSSPSSPLLL